MTPDLMEAGAERAARASGIHYASGSTESGGREAGFGRIATPGESTSRTAASCTWKT
jgi:urea transport system ATP-binding protein